MVEILKMWENLLAATELKSLHMSQAWQLDKFNHGVDNMDVWLNETETVLKSPDFGTDLPTVENLLKEHTLLVKDIQTHKDIVDIISTAATQFSESGHFDLTTIISRKVAYFDCLTYPRNEVTFQGPSCKTLRRPGCADQRARKKIDRFSQGQPALP